MCIKKIYIFLFLLVFGSFVYGQNSSQKEAEIRSFCQVLEQMTPNAGALAWGMIRQLNPKFDEKLVTVGQDGIKRIGLCQLTEDVLEMFAKNLVPEYPYTAKGSISIVSGLYQLVNTQFPDDQKTKMIISAWFMLYGLDGMDSNKRPLSTDEQDAILKVVDYAYNFQKGIF